ncbi:Bifunctional arginine demethylase and lysyl-hydroxylase JMJD6 (Histone arginine demethylase JMJD6) (JmjC domain-containing protein 6) (Jumonji domain-containing protein 6) (Lysyl-hydroxylase JMJD6) (Peptide-lysine 5-dioxygenase JMJD6) (Phosphatidylserine receptor) (Protein PTDSR) [Durusdinium trenchii]|uniref:JmjC domain-containing protein n=1 Tax=Durusdinium trenchii TaxID=1381693 RepID=A0ABP0IYI6_9DINO
MGAKKRKGAKPLEATAAPTSAGKNGGDEEGDSSGWLLKLLDKVDRATDVLANPVVIAVTFCSSILLLLIYTENLFANPWAHELKFEELFNALPSEWDLDNAHVTPSLSRSSSSDMQGLDTLNIHNFGHRVLGQEIGKCTVVVFFDSSQQHLATLAQELESVSSRLRSDANVALGVVDSATETWLRRLYTPSAELGREGAQDPRGPFRFGTQRAAPLMAHLFCGGEWVEQHRGTFNADSLVRFAATVSQTQSRKVYEGLDAARMPVLVQCKSAGELDVTTASVTAGRHPWLTQADPDSALCRKSCVLRALDRNGDAHCLENASGAVDFVRLHSRLDAAEDLRLTATSMLLRKPLVAVVLLDTADPKQQRLVMRDVLEALFQSQRIDAALLHDDLEFVWADIGHWGARLGVSDASWPCVVIVESVYLEFEVGESVHALKGTEASELVIGLENWLLGLTAQADDDGFDLDDIRTRHRLFLEEVEDEGKRVQGVTQDDRLPAAVAHFSSEGPGAWRNSWMPMPRGLSRFLQGAVPGDEEEGEVEDQDQGVFNQILVDPFNLEARKELPWSYGLRTSIATFASIQDPKALIANFTHLYAEYLRWESILISQKESKEANDRVLTIAANTVRNFIDTNKQLHHFVQTMPNSPRQLRERLESGKDGRQAFLRALELLDAELDGFVRSGQDPESSLAPSGEQRVGFGEPCHFLEFIMYNCVSERSNRLVSDKGLEQVAKGPKEVQIDRVSAKQLSVSDFVKTYVEPRRPVIISGVGVLQNPQQPWDLAHLRQTCGQRTVEPVRQSLLSAAHGAMVGNGTQMTLAEFIDGLTASNVDEKSTVREWSLPLHCPEIFGAPPSEAFVVPKYFVADLLQGSTFDPAAAAVYQNYWPALTLAPDGVEAAPAVEPGATHRWSYLAAGGTKEWRIFEGKDRHNLYPILRSQIFAVEDAFAINATRLPLTHKTTMHRGTQRPGDIIFIPAGSLHAARNSGETVSLASNYVDDSNKWEHLWEMLLARQYAAFEAIALRDDRVRGERVDTPFGTWKSSSV